MSIEDTIRLLISSYFGIREMDEYPLKEYILKDIETDIRNYILANPNHHFDFKVQLEQIEAGDLKTKLQDSLLVLNQMDGPMELRLLIKEKLRNLEH